MQAIEAIRLSRTIDKQQIVRDVELSVAPGEVVGVLGPNGSGKSTLLAMLAVATKPSGGEVRLFGSPVSDYAVARSSVGYASDSIAHFGELTGLENALMFAGLYGVELRTARGAIDDMFDRFELAGDAAKPVKKYSFGMKRKLALIESVLHDPAIVLLDEPSIGLDYASEQKLYALIRGWAKDGKAVVVATNNVREAEEVCDRVVFMHKGSLVAGGEPKALIAELGDARTLTVKLAAPLSVEGISGRYIRAVKAQECTVTALVDDDPRAVAELVEALTRAGGDIRGLDVATIDLGSVFMSLVGEEVA